MIHHGTLSCHHPLLANSGRGNTASSPLHASNRALVEPNAPYNATVVLGKFFGRPLINLNDPEFLRGGEGRDAVFFTDALVVMDEN